MIFKAKVYIKNPGEAPQGSKVKRGKRGGYYYESDVSERARQWYSSLENDKTPTNKIPTKRTSNIDGISIKSNSSLNIEARVIGKTIELGNKFNELTPEIKRFVLTHELAHLWTENDKELANFVISNPENAFGEVKVNQRGESYFNGIFGGINPEENFADAVVEYINHPNELKIKHNKAFEFVNNIIPINYKEQLHNILGKIPQQESNIEIIVGDIKDERISDSLEDFAEEGKIEALPPPTREEVQRLVDISGINKNIKVVAVPYWSETVNAWTYMGDDVIYLMSNNAELDKQVLDETRTECYKAGYDIKDMTLENRKIGTIIHEFSHIKTYKKAGITTTSEKDFDRLHFTFRDYEEYIMKHFEKDQDTIFDGEVLLELIAEDGRINHQGRGNEFPHRYFYIDDIKDKQFKEGRAEILRKMGMI